MASQKWEDSAFSDIVTTGLNSLAANARVLTTAISQAGLYLYADFQLLVKYTSTLPPVGSKVAELYLVPQIDGTNYPITGTGVDPQRSLLIGTFDTFQPSTTVFERINIRGVLLPPRDFKLLLKNTNAQPYAASGNILTFRPYRLQVL